jgi:hypothetical protein
MTRYTYQFQCQIKPINNNEKNNEKKEKKRKEGEMFLVRDFFFF